MQTCTCVGMKESFIFKEIRKGMSNANSPMLWGTGHWFLMLTLHPCEEKRMISLRIEVLERMTLVLRVLKSNRWIMCIIINQDDHWFLNSLIFAVCLFTSVL